MLPVKKTSKIIVKKRTLPDEEGSTAKDVTSVQIQIQDKRVDAIDTSKISELSARFDGLASKLDGLESRLDEMSTRLDALKVEETQLWRVDIERRIGDVVSIDLPNLKYLILQRIEDVEVQVQTESEKTNAKIQQTVVKVQDPESSELAVKEPETIQEPDIKPDIKPETIQEPDIKPETIQEPDIKPETIKEPDIKPETIQENQKTSAETEPEIIISKFNETFDATFILDITGTAEAMAIKLHHIGVKNCIIVCPDLPADCLPKDRIVYFIHSAIDTAKEEGWNNVNIIANHLLPHKNLFEAMYISLPLIQSTDWQILHYCSNNHTYEPPQMELNLFNWRNYVILNPDLPEVVQSNEARATQDWCARGFRTGRSATPKLLPTNTHNTLAFCLKSSAFDTILKNLETAIESSRELPLLELPGKKMIISPNLFIVPGTGTSIMKELRWLPQLYLEA
jgi:hypothetical protein